MRCFSVFIIGLVFLAQDAFGDVLYQSCIYALDIDTTYYSTLAACKSGCGLTSYCCPDTYTTCSCPSGWTLTSYSPESNGLAVQLPLAVCTRASVTTTDSTGTYTETYTDCEPTVTEHTQYYRSTTFTTGCSTCRIVLEPVL